MFIKLVRIGKDAELKQSNSGKSFLSLSVVYDIGFGENKTSQWMSLVMFGAQAEKLAQHLTKGKQIVIRADELRTEVYQEKAYLKGTLSSVELSAVASKTRHKIAITRKKATVIKSNSLMMIRTCHSDVIKKPHYAAFLRLGTPDPTHHQQSAHASPASLNSLTE